MPNRLTTQQKALELNLDETIYGTFAEIGAGQDVAGNFFKAGAASGTVAKSISAYDMTFSDAIYGKETSRRYVCQARVEKMVDYEYDLIMERLGKSHCNCNFFSFANTVSARNFMGNNEPHGWLAVKFRSSPKEAPSQLVLHVRMHDQTNLLQQKAIGMLGVNMIYSCFKSKESIEQLIGALMENLTRDSIEIDMINTEGPAFAHLDNRLLSLQLVVKSYTDAVFFDSDGTVKLAKDEFYKKNILLTRGSYRPPTKVNADILETAPKNFSADIEEKKILSIAEITINHLKEDGEITGSDFLARVDLLSIMGQKVLITNMPQFMHLTNYISRFKPKNIGLVFGVYNFMQLFETNYSQFRGGILEALGRLFRSNVMIYLYPYREESQSDKLMDLDGITVNNTNDYLLEYLKRSGQVKNLSGYNDALLHIYSRKVLEMIRNSESGWEDLVPSEVAKEINDECLFGNPTCTPKK
ncbi:MAG: TonB-dependent receptor [Halobacteriovoraceae bacterium]|nr:TonB-dependent receptor [Halobacteriovoraceae bacterium]